ncbi:hypothetical protein SAMN05216337_109311 [Bradyrhizobium brasilense]|uniref:Uncharacterized protein n=1 Tax=Bradyrhizobium brasilense TaxID=1419277 RepID=A0A1G7Q9B5_9BRAD|nr:hypothetical protein SAMN05216337_109311 [Bradyrhizobium brasilense]
MTAHVSDRFEYFWIPKCDGEFFANASATVRSIATTDEPYSANVGSKFPRRSPLFTSVLFNQYSTNAAEGYLSA